MNDITQMNEINKQAISKKYEILSVEHTPLSVRLCLKTKGCSEITYCTASTEVAAYRKAAFWSCIDEEK